jgi:hypothetical protein
MGMFSTDQRYLLDDESGQYEIGKTLPGKKFLEELKEEFVLPMCKYMGEEEPTIKLLASNSMTHEQKFKLLTTLWAFEHSVGALHGTWLLGYKFGEKHGEYKEVEYMEVRQIWEEFKHARLYEDAILRVGYLTWRRELYSHPYCQMMPNAVSFHAWLQQLGPYPIPVRGAGGPLATEMPFGYWLETTARETVDPMMRGCFEAQVLEERMHGQMGEYQVLKYARTSELQAMCRWSTKMALELMTRWGQEFYNWLLQEDAGRLRQPTQPLDELYGERGCEDETAT